MTAQISAYGRLVADPQTRTTSSDKLMAFARLVVNLPCQAAQDGTAPLWLGVVAFGRQAEALAKHQKGDMVSVSGNMQVNQWTDQTGATQSGFQVVADSVISARTSTPVGRTTRQQPAQQQQGQSTGQHQRPPQGWEMYPRPDDEDQSQPFDDRIPF